MSYPTDLLPFGEGFAELDLVVRQLDDGSLTVADDDTQADEERVHVTADEVGLHATLRVVAVDEPPADVIAALAGLGTSERFAWREGWVRCEAVLPWTPDHQFTPTELEALYGCVMKGAAAQRAAIERLARGEAAEAPVQIPPSYLPGAGQADKSQSLTSRYGAIEAVPGRGELAPSDRRPSGRREPVSARLAAPAGRAEGGGGASSVALVMVAGIVGLGALTGVVVMRGSQAPSTSTAMSSGPPTTGEATPAADHASEERDDTREPSSDEEQPADPRPPRATRQPSSPPPPRALDGAEAILAAAASPDAELRRRAVERWVELELDRAPGARLELLKALARRLDREVGALLLQSLRDHPPETFEALDCLEWGNEAMKRQLIQQLGRPGTPEPDLVAEVLAEQEETEDLLIEEALLRLGRPRAGAAQRLLAKRGLEWVRLGGGMALFELLPLAQLEPLASHTDADVRMLAADLIKAKGSDGGKEALTLLLELLKDREARVRQRAVEGLTQRKDPRSAWALARALRTERDNLTKDMLRSALEALDPPSAAARYLDQLRRKQEGSDPLAAVEALQAIPKPEAVAALVLALDDGAREVRLAALGALQTLARRPGLKDEVKKGILPIRRLAKDADREVSRLAKQLHYAVEGRMP